MTEKIEWYREVLALEPNSKIFFPLARMLEREGELAQACEVLKEGVRRHGEFLEARLFLVELLERLGRRDECAAEVEVLAGMLARYEGFWSAWSASAGRAGQDPALFVRMLGLSLKQPDLTVAELLRRGLDSFGQGQGKAWDQPGAVQTGTVQSGAAQPEAIRSGAVQPEAAQPEAPRPASSEPALPASEAAGDAPSLSEASASDAIGTRQTPVPSRAASRLAAEEAPAEGQRLPAAEAEAMPEETSAGASCAEPAEAKPAAAEAEPAAAEADPVPGKAEPATAEAKPESAEAEPAPGKAGGASLKPAAAKRPVQAPKAGGTSLRTRSMAEVLAEQGDLASAAEIYDELAMAAPEGERDVLLRRRDELKALQAAQPQAPGRAAEVATEGAASSTRKILNLLETLAVRVEARANS